MSLDLLTAGEIMVAFRFDSMLRLGGSAEVSIAGAEGNVAIGAARLGHSAAWTGRLGTDESGALVERTLHAEGIATSTVVRDAAAATGLILFEQRLPDVTRVEYHRAHSAGSRWCPDDVAPAIGLGPKIVHLSGITPALSETAAAASVALLRAAREAGALVSFDVNHRARLWEAATAAPVLSQLARLADIVIASPEELALVAADAEELLRSGAREIVVKDGARGARVHTREADLSAPALSVPAVDSVGAGDAFTAGYLSGILDGLDLEARLRRAIATGGFAVMSRGDWEGLPRRDELELALMDRGEAIR